MKAKHANSGIAGATILIGLGVLFMTGNWWPGIVIVIGLAIGGDHAFRGNYMQAMIALALCSAILLIAAVKTPWNILGPFILISLGALVLMQAVRAREH